MASPKKLLAAEDNWQTKMGLWFPGERVVLRGKDLFTELGDMRWMELLLFAITGRHFSENEVKLFEGIWVLCTSYPDPRLWNNRVASLCGTTRSTSAFALGAGTAISEAEIYGGQPILGCFNLIKKIDQLLKKGDTLTNILTVELENRPIPGYGRPITNTDERILPLAKLAQEFSLSDGDHYGLVFEIEDELLEISKKRKNNWQIKMNISAVMSALAADMQFSAFEYHQFMTLCFSAGMFPCYSEASHKVEGTFLPLRCGRIFYQGKEPRNWQASV